MLTLVCPESSMKLVASIGASPSVPTKITSPAAIVMRRCPVANRITGTYTRRSTPRSSRSSAARRIPSASPAFGGFRNQ